jgi:hypothetical protein
MLVAFLVIVGFVVAISTYLLFSSTTGVPRSEFMTACEAANGAVNFYKSDHASDAFSGTLLSCQKLVEYGSKEVILFAEIQDIQQKIKAGVYAPKNERERLITYFNIVYPEATSGEFDEMSTDNLVDYWKNLELYYKLPIEIMPQTPVTIRRDGKSKFYTVPDGIILDQSQNRTSITTPYIEVTRAGSDASFLRNPMMFTGTYYYPAKGSGVFLPLENTLVAYNKVHALKMLDVPNTSIVTVGGTDFQFFLQRDSEKLWRAIKIKTPEAARQDYFDQACVVDKHATAQDPESGCNLYMGKFTKKVFYIPAALNNIIAEMVAGKAVRVDKRRGRNIYYGIGDTGDGLLAQLARDRDYTTVQLLREAQMSLTEDPVVGSELIHLMEAVYSQRELKRLNPFLRPYISPQRYPINVNYLLDPSIIIVNKDLLTDGVWDPNTARQSNLDIIQDA